MKKHEFNSVFRNFVDSEITPTSKERSFVSLVYGAVMEVLGESKCFQIGSFSRFTAIRPLHDLDVLYEVGPWNGAEDPKATLDDLHKQLDRDFDNPTQHEITISQQSHSITISFTENQEEIFSVDVVPAYTFSKNEYGDSLFMVPEITRVRHSQRPNLYEKVERGESSIGWLKSDPKGYIKAAKDLNDANGDFRRSVKFIKAWRNSCKESSDRFKMKSFHIEQVVSSFFEANAESTIFDAIFCFFTELENTIREPQIPDRADATVFIDQYLEDLTSEEKSLILEFRDCFMIKLEEFEESSNVEDLLTACQRKRRSMVEKYLFDYGIPVLTESNLEIRARAIQSAGFRGAILALMERIQPGRKVEFRLSGQTPAADLFKWKVKNDDNSHQPRGEITDHKTAHDPESTKYIGDHYVECFAIKNNVCIAKGRRPVNIRAF